MLLTFPMFACKHELNLMHPGEQLVYLQVKLNYELFHFHSSPMREQLAASQLELAGYSGFTITLLENVR